MDKQINRIIKKEKAEMKDLSKLKKMDKKMDKKMSKCDKMKKKK